MAAVVQVVGSSRPVRAEDLPRLRGVLGTPSLAWRDGDVSFRGSGEAAVLAGARADDVLGRAAASSVDVRGERMAPPGEWFAGFAFDAAAPRDGWWESFPAARAFLPRLLLASSPLGGSLTAYEPLGAGGEQAARRRADDALRSALSCPAPREPAASPPRPASLREDFPAWEALVVRALEVLHQGMLRKVVLARAIDVEAEAPLDLALALERAESSADGAVVYAVRGADGTAFLGASPERLARVEGRRFVTQALAASAAPEDAARLARSAKETAEHRAVVEDIRDALEGIAERVEVAGTSAVSLGYVTHLDARIEGTLRGGVRPHQLALALHPTAAVGGSPRERARDFLRRHEHLARGWYAGAVGWVGEAALDLRVALRCALLRGPSARLFVGAGVVEGSTARAEWEETRRKAVPMLRALLGEAPWPR